MRLIWVVDPAVREFMIYRANGTIQRLREHELLSGEDVVPGFSSLMKDYFPDP